MPNYVRWRREGASYFFTVVTYRRQRILTGKRTRRMLFRAMVSVRRRLPFDMPVYVVLSDHLHCIWSLPEGDDDFPTRWRQIKSLFTREYLKSGGRDWDVSSHGVKEGRRGVWQPRYWEHRLRDEADYDRHRDYIHLNPVQHGYVDRPEDWAWSSFRRHVRLGWLDPDWPGMRAVALPDVRE